MRFSALILSGMAAMAMAVPVMVTRTSTAIVTVTQAPVQPAVNLPAQHFVVATQIITVRPGTSPTSSGIGFWSMIGEGTATHEVSVEHTSTSFHQVVPAFTDPATLTSRASLVFTTVMLPSTNPSTLAFPSTDVPTAYPTAMASNAVAAPSPSFSPSSSNGFDYSDPGFNENNMAHECAGFSDIPVLVKLCTDSLIAHNRHRRNHTAPAIHWDQGLFMSASIVASSCNFSHSMDVNGGEYGQNLQVGSTIDNIQAAITNSWYDSEVTLFPENEYGYDTPPSMETGDNSWERYGHFTQLVWAASTRVGCAVQQCQQLKCNPNNSGCPSNGLMGPNFGNSLTVCNYQVPGNFKGYFAGNLTKAVPNNPSYNTYHVSE